MSGKRLIFIGGTMGVGKTATSQILSEILGNCIYLDGDWCYNMHPFYVTEETKEMAIENICFLLNNFIKCSVCENIVFSWVMHQQCIIDEILSRLDISDCNVYHFSLVCSDDALIKRLRTDIDKGRRQPDIIEKSLNYLPRYKNINSIKMDVTNISAEESAQEIVRIVENTMN